MADLFVKHWPVGPEWTHGAGVPKFILEMDEYEFANLRWLLDKVWSNQYAGVNLHTGDWAGQIRHALVDGTSRLPFELRPNAGAAPKG